MSAHTPGPWAVHPHFAFIVPASHTKRSIGGAEDDAFDLAHYAQEIAAMRFPDRHRPESETRANACLIAAAPELLKELKHLVCALRPWLESGHGVPGIATVNGAMRAIEKATQP